MSALSLSGVEVSYGRVPVLLDVDIEVVDGSICALVGTNGAGKSTVLRAATGLVRPSRGRVRLFGQDITRLTPEERVGRGLVLVAGGRATFPSLSVEESVRIGTYSFRHNRSRVEDAVAAALAPFPRLVERRTQLAGTLSGGEQQLLALARALAMAPRVLLVDELTLGLAPAAADEVLAAVTELAGTGVTVVLVEQSIRRALAVAETAYFLERGQVRFDGPAAALATRTDLLRPVLLAP